MWQKRGVAKDLKELPPSKRFRANLADAFLSNQLSRQRTQSIIDDAALAGVEGVGDLRSNASSSSSPTMRN